jgi:hypothetical protein
VKNTLTSENQRDFDGISLRLSNALVIKRAPEIFVVQIESALLPSYTGSVTSLPDAVSFPYSFDLETIFNTHSSQQASREDSGSSDNIRLYELIAVSSLEGNDLSELHSYFRVGSKFPCPAQMAKTQVDVEADLSHPEMWYHGGLDSLEIVSRDRVVDGNYYQSVPSTSEGTQSPKRTVHPRLLVYARKSLAQTLERTSHSVSKGLTRFI